MAIDVADVREALANAEALFAGDGVGLVLVSFDEHRDAARVRVDLSRVECLECVLSPDILAELIADALKRHDRAQGLDVQVDDPRKSPTSNSLKQEGSQ